MVEEDNTKKITLTWHNLNVYLPIIGPLAQIKAKLRKQTISDTHKQIIKNGYWKKLIDMFYMPFLNIQNFWNKKIERLYRDNLDYLQMA